MNSNDQINVFFLETELQCLAYRNIRAKLGEGAPYVLLATLKSVYDYLNCRGEETIFLDKESHGWLGRFIRVRKNLRTVRLAIQEQNPVPSEIHYHTSRIDGLFSNLMVGYLKYHFPSAEVHTRLIPDGAINIFSTQISERKVERLMHWSRDWAIRLFPDMKITNISGDELGADVDEVDRIYCFEGVATHYPENKIQRVPLMNGQLDATNDSQIERKALVIGQNFLQLGTANKVYVDAVSQKIKNFLEMQNIETVDYVPHPRSKYNEFWDESYNWVENKELCVEQLIATGHYTHIISCYSSALINSKIIMGEGVQVLSVGLEAFPFRSQEQANQLSSAYQKAGIQLMPLQSVGVGASA